MPPRLKPSTRRKSFALRHLFERLDEASAEAEFPLLTERQMFGGLAIYFRGRMVAVLMEQAAAEPASGGQSGQNEDWNGVLLPTSREYHASLLADLGAGFQDLKPSPRMKGRSPSRVSVSETARLGPHPILGKWLYAHAAHPRLEEIVGRWTGWVVRNPMDPRVGIEPKPRRRAVRKQVAGKRSRGPKPGPRTPRGKPRLQAR